MLRVYLDSNVFIAFIRSEIGKPFKLMYRDVEDFLKQCPKNYILVLSDIAASEIEKKTQYSKNGIIEIFNKFKIVAEFVESGKNETDLARELLKKGIHYSDALHAAIAINSKCEIFLTFNKKDFEAINEKIQIKEPIELIY